MSEQLSFLPAHTDPRHLAPPYGWEHLPIKAARPWKLPNTLHFARQTVTWSCHLNDAEAVLRDDRLPWFEVGLRPGFEARAPCSPL